MSGIQMVRFSDMLDKLDQLPVKRQLEYWTIGHSDYLYSERKKSGIHWNLVRKFFLMLALLRRASFWPPHMHTFIPVVVVIVRSIGLGLIFDGFIVAHKSWYVFEIRESSLKHITFPQIIIKHSCETPALLPVSINLVKHLVEQGNEILVYKKKELLRWFHYPLCFV